VQIILVFNGVLLYIYKIYKAIGIYTINNIVGKPG